MQTIPDWLKGHLKPEDLEKVEKAVSRGESQTSAEIVPMVVRSSSATGHIPAILLLLGAVIGLVLDIVGVQSLHLELPLWVWPAFTLLWLGLTRILTPRPWVQRLFTPKEDLIRQVLERAQLEFYQAALGTTRDKTGILIFISLMEHQAVVLADRAIAEKNKPDTWQGVLGDILSGIKSKNLAEGLNQGIERCAKICAPDFPRKTDDSNELPNTLRIQE